MEPAKQHLNPVTTSAGGSVFPVHPLQSPEILAKAAVPEHSVNFMRSMSGGEPFLSGEYLFFSEQDWLMGIGYPLGASYDISQFRAALENALEATGARQCWVICPDLPPELTDKKKEQDEFYVLDPWQEISPTLTRLNRKAALSLELEMGSDFTDAHSLLWDEFLSQNNLPPRVMRLYTRTPGLMGRTKGLVFLNAWDRQGNLAACLVVDTAPGKFLSYIIGAHSKKHYTPYASDLLFSRLINLARSQGKEFIHLGLGVNQGIKRFKVKWGGRPYCSYQLAEWRTGFVPADLSVLTPEIMENKARYLMSLPRQKEFRMLWEIEKQGKHSWIGGTAHFFSCSFRHHFEKLFDQVHTVIFEGPLDQVSMQRVAAVGCSPGPEFEPLARKLSRDEVQTLKRVVRGPEGFWARLLNSPGTDLLDVDYYLSSTRHWMAFFSIWSAFLRRIGWDQSVDREAWDLAKQMEKNVVAMESIDEQIATLESIPRQRILRFFKNCGQWKKLAAQNEKAYLRGDLENMFGTSTEFPSRTELVIHRRDELFLERMKPYLEEGGCMVFVGTAHMLGLGPMLEEAGFGLSKCC
ncbi:TraB/GumN family protein [Desulfonatronovibrio hydrogenovorans]|uniref:TraB/GumN family protein n=1 Tax=Desulfonatronovibrio hydrogenovorans TaxID=53245 RepID=UPI000A048B1A|nr:TraB/GumN family protein [Desulfonatronovibrio hydrogenovorans]